MIFFNQGVNDNNKSNNNMMTTTTMMTRVAGKSRETKDLVFTYGFSFQKSLVTAIPGRSGTYDRKRFETCSTGPIGDNALSKNS